MSLTLARSERAQNFLTHANYFGFKFKTDSGVVSNMYFLPTIFRIENKNLEKVLNFNLLLLLIRFNLIYKLIDLHILN